MYKNSGTSIQKKWLDAFCSHQGGILLYFCLVLVSIESPILLVRNDLPIEEDGHLAQVGDCVFVL